MSTSEELYSFQSKWSYDIAQLGFTAVPNALLRAYTLLDMTPTQFLVFVNIDSYRWSAEKDPFPSIETLAGRTNLSERTVTRAITALEKKHRLLKRIPRRYSSNAYSFEEGIDTLTAFSEWTNYDISPRHR